MTAVGTSTFFGGGPARAGRGAPSAKYRTSPEGAVRLNPPVRQNGGKEDGIGPPGRGPARPRYSRISNASSDSTDYDYAGRTAPVTSSTSPLQPRTSASSPSLFHSPCTPCQPDPRHRPAVPRRLVCLSHQRTFSTTSAESGMTAFETETVESCRSPAKYERASSILTSKPPPCWGTTRPRSSRSSGWSAVRRLRSSS